MSSTNIFNKQLALKNLHSIHFRINLIEMNFYNYIPNKKLQETIVRNMIHLFLNTNNENVFNQRKLNLLGNNPLFGIDYNVYPLMEIDFFTRSFLKTLYNYRLFDSLLIVYLMITKDYEAGGFSKDEIFNFFFQHFNKQEKKLLYITSFYMDDDFNRFVKNKYNFRFTKNTPFEIFNITHSLYNILNLDSLKYLFQQRAISLFQKHISFRLFNRLLENTSCLYSIMQSNTNPNKDELYIMHFQLNIEILKGILITQWFQKYYTPVRDHYKTIIRLFLIMRDEDITYCLDYLFTTKHISIKSFMDAVMHHQDQERYCYFPDLFYNYYQYRYQIFSRMHRLFKIIDYKLKSNVLYQEYIYNNPECIVFIDDETKVNDFLSYIQQCLYEMSSQFVLSSDNIISFMYFVKMPSYCYKLWNIILNTDHLFDKLISLCQQYYLKNRNFIHYVFTCINDFPIDPEYKPYFTQKQFKRMTYLVSKVFTIERFLKIADKSNLPINKPLQQFIENTLPHEYKKTEEVCYISYEIPEVYRQCTSNKPHVITNEYYHKLHSKKCYCTHPFEQKIYINQTRPFM